MIHIIFFLFSQILDVIREGLDKGPTAGFEAEARGFGELAMTPESKGLVSLFKGQTQCKKNRFGKPSKEVKTVGVLGAGRIIHLVVEINTSLKYP